MKNVKGLLFDFNGTLFFDSKMHIRIFQKYFAEHGKEAPSAEYVVKNIFGRSNQQNYNEHFESKHPDDWKAFSNECNGNYRQYCIDHPEETVLTSGAYEMLDYLKENNIPYAIATGSGIDNVNFYFEHIGLGKWFSNDNLVYADGTYPGKPAPDIWYLAAKKLGLEPSECAVFEDGTSGIIAAHAAGAASVICVYDHSLPTPLTDGLSADKEYSDFSDWKDMLRYLGFEVK